MLDAYATRYLASLRRSPRTREEYGRDLNLFIAWAKRTGKLDPRDITSAEIEEFLIGLKRKDGIRYAAVSRNRVLAVVKGYYKFLVKDRVLAALDDPAAMVSAQKRPRRAPVFLEMDEGSRMILQVRDRPVETPFQEMMKARDLALLTLLLGSGLRISELYALNTTTWRESLLNGWLTVIGKGDKERVVPPSDEAVERVQKYLRVRPEVPPDAEGHPLFVSRKNTRLTQRQIERIIKEMAQEAEIAKKITPHKLRATWVTQLLISGANPREVQAMAGHESLDTTMIYAGVRDHEELKRTVKKHQVRYV
ncbi:MAG TPA: tyrosine-type recombinase/integrase [Symbiobacteriaceae bacterium]|jgi:integrase/recombinase XerD|nr:tyrosine-type recombinase/integrase [Symbiobacteriaceae bacterium]